METRFAVEAEGAVEGHSAFPRSQSKAYSYCAKHKMTQPPEVAQGTREKELGSAQVSRVSHTEKLRVVV